MATVLLCLSALVLASPPALGAVTTCDNFVASASADGIRTGVSSPGFLIVDSADVESPLAQAYVDALGQSQAVAAAPYPGDTVLSALALGGVAQSKYPLAATSQYPTKSDGAVDTPALKLDAHSSELRSSSAARAGNSATEGLGSAGVTHAVAQAQCTPTAVTADAENAVDGFSVADGVLRIGAVHSEAHASRQPGQKPSLTSEMQAVDITVAGQRVALTDQGLVAPGQATTRLPDNPVLSALKQAGLEVEYIKAAADPDGRGVTSAGLRITVQREVTGTGPTEITYTLGRAYARASGSDQEASSFVPPAGPISMRPVHRSAPAVASGSATAPGLSGAPGGPPISAASAGTEPSASAEAAPPPTEDQVQTASFKPPDVSLAGGYLAVMGVAVVMLISGLVVRIFGVKLGWT